MHSSAEARLSTGCNTDNFVTRQSLCPQIPGYPIDTIGIRKKTICRPRRRESECVYVVELTPRFSRPINWKRGEESGETKAPSCNQEEKDWLSRREIRIKRKQGCLSGYQSHNQIGRCPKAVSVIMSATRYLICTSQLPRNLLINGSRIEPCPSELLIPSCRAD